MKVKGNVKAGLRGANHDETLLPGAAKGLEVQTGVNPGSLSPRPYGVVARRAGLTRPPF